MIANVARAEVHCPNRGLAFLRFCFFMSKAPVTDQIVHLGQALNETLIRVKEKEKSGVKNEVFDEK